MNFIDYVFYRLAKVYFKYDGKTSASAKAILSGSQTFLIISIVMLFCLCIMERNNIQEQKEILILVLFVSYILFSIINGVRYKNKFDEFEQKWSSQSKQKKMIGGWLVFLTIAFSFFLPIVIVALSLS